MRNTEPSRKNEHGDEVHPAFGMISASRMSSTPGQVLFDSDIKHGHTVRITISRAKRQRDLNRDWIYGDEELIEVELSEAQWASFVSSMNTSGVPATLRRTESEVFVPGLEYDPRLAHSMQEVRDSAEKLFAHAKQAMAEYDALDSKAPAKEKRAAISKLRTAVTNAEANMAFAAKSLSEHTENVVQKARADIEAMVMQKAAALGLTAGDTQTVLELPVLAGEERDTLTS